MQAEHHFGTAEHHYLTRKTGRGSTVQTVFDLLNRQQDIVEFRRMSEDHRAGIVVVAGQPFDHVRNGSKRERAGRRCRKIEIGPVEERS